MLHNLGFKTASLVTVYLRQNTLNIKQFVQNYLCHGKGLLYCVINFERAFCGKVETQVKRAVAYKGQG